MSGTPHKCPKCNGTNWLQYDPQSPYGAGTTNCGPWQCNACINGIIWSYPPGDASVAPKEQRYD
jgi:hypothetical protein